MRAIDPRYELAENTCKKMKNMNIYLLCSMLLVKCLAAEELIARKDLILHCGKSIQSIQNLLAGAYFSEMTYEIDIQLNRNKRASRISRVGTIAFHYFLIVHNDPTKKDEKIEKMINGYLAGLQNHPDDMKIFFSPYSGLVLHAEDGMEAKITLPENIFNQIKKLGGVTQSEFLFQEFFKRLNKEK